MFSFVDDIYRVHPHSLVGANCKNDFCRAEVDAGTMTKTFTQLGIQCAKKMDVTEALQLRRKYNVDPFGGINLSVTVFFLSFACRTDLLELV